MRVVKMSRTCVEVAVVAVVVVVVAVVVGPVRWDWR